MSVKFNFKIQGKSPEEIFIDIKKKEKQIQERIKELGQKSYDFMIGYINSQRKRAVSSHSDENSKASKESLTTAIQINYFAFGWGIGEISHLKTVSPHWAFINYGGTPPSTADYPSLRGHFDNGGLFQKGKPKFPIYPKRYNGINYIDYTKAIIDSQIKNILK